MPEYRSFTPIAAAGGALLALSLAVAPALAAPAPKPAAKPQAPQSPYGPPAEGTARPAPTATPKAAQDPKRAVREVVVRGNRRISDDRILLSIPISPGDRAGRAEVLDAIQRIYGMGYFQDVKADAEPVAGGERLIFNVVENPVLGDVTFQGVTKLDAAKLETHFEALKGDIVNYNALKASVDAVQKEYADAGYPLARVGGMDFAPGGILRLRVAEGRIHAIRFTGNEETKEYVLRRELSVKPGDVFYAPQVQADLRRIFNLNYFEDLNLKFEPGPTPEDVVVVMDVKEKQTGSINLGAGYSTRDGILGMLSLKKDNLFGTGQQVGLDFSISQQLRLAGELTYFNPWFDEARTGVGGSAYLRRFNNFLGDFREDRLGGSFNASRPLFGQTLQTPWRGTAGVRLERVSTYQNLFIGGDPKATYADGRPITLSPDATDNIVGGTLGLSFDTRDVIANPTEGQFHTLSVEPFLVNASAPLLKGILAGNMFIPLPAMPWAPDQRTTLAIGTRAGLIGGAQVPAYERFFSTGPYLVRGWPEFVTPENPLVQQYGINYFQGSNALVGTLEYRFPIFNIVSGAFFGDTGLFWDNDTFDLRNLHSGYGAGLRLNTPLGAIRLDYGLNGQTPGQFHFGIGNRF